MKKIIFLFYLSFLPVFVYAQPATDTVCRAHIEKIFKVLDLKIKCGAVMHFEEFSENKNSEITIQIEETQYARYFEEITGIPLDSGKYKGAISVKIDVDNFAKKLNYSSSQAWQEYEDLIKNIKSDKEICLKCIDAELAKGDSSEYANKTVIPYNYYNPKSRWASIWVNPLFLAKSDYLKVFKEFIFNDNKEVLPHDLRAVAYLKCGCKIPGL